MRSRIGWWLGIACALASASAQAFTPGSLLIVEPFTGIRQWTPGAATSTLVIKGPPLGDPRAVAIDASGNAIVTDRASGTFRYGPDGSLSSDIGVGGFDVAVGPNGGVYVLDEGGSVWLMPATLVASGIPDPRGLAVTRDDAGNNLVLVTSGANNGQLLRVAPGPTAVVQGSLGTNLERPGVDRFGNVLVPGNVFATPVMWAIDPVSGRRLGNFQGSAVIDAQDVTATSGDRYFVADGDAGGNCRILEIDPIAGGITLVGVAPVCGSTPWGIAAVPGGTPAPKLATNDLVMTDPLAFGGGGAIFRIDPATGAARPLRFGLEQFAVAGLSVGPTRELAFGTDWQVGRIFRLDPQTGRTTLLYTMPPGLVGPAHEKQGNLFFGGIEPSCAWCFDVVRLDRATGVAGLDIWHGYFGYFAINRLDSAQSAIGLQGGDAWEVYSSVAVYRPPGSWWWFGDYIYAPTSRPAYNIRTLAADMIVNSSPSGFRNVRTSTVIPVPDAVSPRGLAGRAYPGASWGIHYLADADAYGGGGAIFQELNGVVTRLTTTSFVEPTTLEVVPPPACSDGVDNDDDGQIDFPADTGCTVLDDPWESTDCTDGIDNDMDGTIDYDPNGDGDPGCSSLPVGIEDPQCSNGVDDDGDGRVDGNDPQCTGPTANRESPQPACGLGVEIVLVLAAGWATSRRVRRRLRSAI